MSQRRKTLRWLLAAIVVALVGGVYYTRRAMQEVQPFYAEAIQEPSQQLESAGQRMENRVAELYEEASQPGRWQTVFTDQEVNGWLAMILKEKYPDFLPPQVADPRVAFKEGRCMVGYRYKGSFFDTVVAVEGTAWMESEDVAAVRLEKASAGALPLPMSKVVAQVTDGANRLSLAHSWRDEEGLPVLLVPVSGALSTDEETRRLETVEVRDGELVLAGITTPKIAQRPRLVRQFVEP